MNSSCNKLAIILLAIHNRRDFTLKCLSTIEAQTVPDGWETKVLVVDDGSTDGSAEAIESGYPEVTVIKGDGSLYWGGGMELAMESACRIYDPEALIWMNDDVELSNGAIACILGYHDEHDDAVSGLSVSDEQTGQNLVYGGRVLNRWNLKVSRVEPKGDVPIEVDCLNGNLVLIPKKVFETIGNVHGDLFRHGGGDFDYTLRAKKAGFPLVLLPGIGGRSLHDHVPKDKSKKINRIKRLKEEFSVKGFDLRGWWHFCIRYSYLGPVLYLWSVSKRLFNILLLNKNS